MMTAPHECVRLEFDVAITVRSPFLFRGLAAKLMGLDAAALRDERGRALIPADQVRGCLRDAFEDLAASGGGLTVEELESLLGAPSRDEDTALGSNLPSRTRLYITDLVDQSEHEPNALEATRVAIDDESGAAGEGMLQVLELVAEPGVDVRFVGNLVAYLPLATASGFPNHLRNAFHLIRQIGSIKTAGFGRVVGTELRARPRGTQPVAISPLTEKTWRRFHLTLDRHFLVDALRHADNAVQGASIIPGSVLKGALARKLELAGLNPSSGTLADALAALVVGHAFLAVAGNEKPSRSSLPLSLAADRKNRFVDALTLEPDAVVLFRNESGHFDVGGFGGDIKTEVRRSIARKIGWVSEFVPTLPRTHTAINHGGIADEARIFTTLACSHEMQSTTGAWERRRWLVDVDWAAALRAAPDETRKLLDLLEHEDGIEGIGKTHATARLTPADADLERLTPFQEGGKTYAIVLKTPAYMVNMAEAKRCTPDDAWCQKPQEVYARYFAKVLPGARLLNCFARQELRGGYFSRRHRIGKAYYPFLLTMPGSVFLLEVKEENDRMKLERLARTGLPAATVGEDQHRADWRNCPFVPENGFGHFWPDYQAQPALYAEAVDV